MDVLQINSIPANKVVNNLGVYFDPELLMERQVNKLCQVCYFHLQRLRTVRRWLTKESLLTLMHAFITSRVDHVTVSSTGRMDIFSTDFNPSWTRLRGWSWVFLSSTAFLLPSAMNFTGYRSGNSSGSRSLSSCDSVSSVRRPCIWQNSVVRWVHPLVGRVYALAHVVISLFQDSDFEDLATGLLLSLGPTCGTLFRPKLDNCVTIYYSSRVNWKHFCSSSPEPFCGSISNEGSYKYSILPLLLLLISSHVFCHWSLLFHQEAY